MEGKTFVQFSDQENHKKAISSIFSGGYSILMPKPKYNPSGKMFGAVYLVENLQLEDLEEMGVSFRRINDSDLEDILTEKSLRHLEAYKEEKRPMPPYGKIGLTIHYLKDKEQIIYELLEAYEAEEIEETEKKVITQLPTGKELDSELYCILNRQYKHKLVGGLMESIVPFHISVDDPDR
jgi:hypothetical protein